MPVDSREWINEHDHRGRRISSGPSRSPSRLTLDKPISAGEPYFSHCKRVADAVEGDDERIVGFLHDVVEKETVGPSSDWQNLASAQKLWKPSMRLPTPRRD